MFDVDPLGLLVAALGGAAVGLERQWSGHASGESARFAGIRTFTLLGLLGGLSGSMWLAGLTGLAIVLAAGAAAIVGTAYVAGARKDIDGTTEVAALVVVGAGVVAGLGVLRVASGVFAVVTLLLAEKTRLHAAVKKIDDVGLRAGIRFAALALVVLPILPEGPYGPLGGIRPRELWALTLFFSGLSFLGYVARQLVGPDRGYLAAGLLAGMVSSTNATFAFARQSAHHAKSATALAFGAVAANAMLYPRVLVATAALNQSLVLPLLPYLAPPAIIAAAVAALGLRQRGTPSAADDSTRNPLQLGAALQVSVVFQVVLMLVHVARGRWGNTGVIGSAAVLGLTDVDALTTSMARSGAAETSLDLAAIAIATGILSNTVMKLALALSLGRGRFRLVAGATLLAMALAGSTALVILARNLS